MDQNVQKGFFPHLVLSAVCLVNSTVCSWPLIGPPPWEFSEISESGLVLVHVSVQMSSDAGTPCSRELSASSMMT